MNILVKSFGCSANMSDGEIIKGILSNADFNIVDEPAEEIAMIILNICTVKGDDSALTEIRKIKEKYPYAFMIVAGCIPKWLISKIKEIKEDITLINTHNVRDILSAVEETVHYNPQKLTEFKRKPKILMHKKRENPIVGIVPISNGCLGKCSYCSVKLIKGKLYSYPVDLIIKEVETCVKQRCKQIWITAQDTACYGKDINTNIVSLLEKVLDIKGDFYVRLGMGNPHHIKENLDELIKVFKHPKMFKFLHIPLQSGSDEVLKAMNRPYKAADFKEIITKFKEEIPEITIATDVIIGFPGETNEQFYETIHFIQEIQPDVLNISKFVDRPETAASNMKNKVEGAEIKERSRKMTNTFEFISFEQNKKWKNWQGEVLIDEKGTKETMKGRNFAYKPVIVSEECEIGDKIDVKITNTAKHDLRGEKILSLK